MSQTVTLIRGDGITREMTDPVLELLDAAGAALAYDEQPAGFDGLDAHGTLLPEPTLASLRRHRVGLKGRLLTPQGAGHQSPNAELRKRMGLFATVRPLRNMPGLPSRHHDVDIVLIRETTEDIYAGLEHSVSDGVVGSLKVVTEAACARISRFAFEYARRYNRKKVTLIHKANIMKVTDGLFIRTAEQVAADYPEVTFNKLIVDNACMQLLMWPQQYDVVLSGNLYGDIFSDLGAGVIGGISATYGACSSEDVSVFEAIHGDAPELVGKGVANPLPLLLPACAMLEHIGQDDVARRLIEAIHATLRAGQHLTPDLGGQGDTRSMLGAIRAHLGD